MIEGHAWQQYCLGDNLRIFLNFQSNLNRFQLKLENTKAPFGTKISLCICSKSKFAQKGNCNMARSINDAY